MNKTRSRASERVGMRVRELRSKSAISRAMLAARADLDVSHLARIEGGRGNPTLFVLLQLATALVPHFQRALRIQHDLSAASHQIRNISSAMDNVTRIGMAVVDCALSVRYLNTAAENIVRRHDGLTIREGSFEFAHPPADATLRHGINVALGQTGSVRGGTSLLCPRPSGLRPYVIHVLPFQHVTAPLAESRALVLILDPEQHPQPDTEMLRRLYGLTTAEAAVAIRLIQGDGIKPIAESMCLSAGTVRTHVQHIFDKTGTHRQAELVRTLLAISL